MLSRLLAVLWVLVAALISACSEERLFDVSAQHRYRELVGQTYIVKSPVVAYGIRKHSKAPLEYMTIIPSPGIDGSEVGLRLPIPVGSSFVITAVHESNRLFDHSITVYVKFEGAKAPNDLPVRIDLMRGNQGVNSLSLNPEFFQRR